MLQLYGGGLAVAAAQVALVYYSACVAIHYIAPLLFPIARESIQVQPRARGQVLREATYSLGPIAVKAMVLTIVERLHAAGATRMYDGPFDTLPKVAYAVATVGALDVLHDAWFYATHRLLHWRPVYKHIHHIHHQSVAPTAFTGYSFHCAEGALVFANEIVVTFLFPVHAGLHRAYHLFTTVIHNGGHAGYEIAPYIPSLAAALAGLASALLGGGAAAVRSFRSGLNTVQHHDMHHRFPTRHFSLYFTHWDRWLGTEHPHYQGQVAAHKVGTLPADWRPPAKAKVGLVGVDGLGKPAPAGAALRQQVDLIKAVY